VFVDGVCRTNDGTQQYHRAQRRCEMRKENSNGCDSRVHARHLPVRLEVESSRQATALSSVAPDTTAEPEGHPLSGDSQTASRDQPLMASMLRTTAGRGLLSAPSEST